MSTGVPAPVALRQILTVAPRGALTTAATSCAVDGIPLRPTTVSAFVVPPLIEARLSGRASPLSVVEPEDQPSTRKPARTLPVALTLILPSASGRTVTKVAWLPTG